MRAGKRHHVRWMERTQAQNIVHIGARSTHLGPGFALSALKTVILTSTLCIRSVALAAFLAKEAEHSTVT